MPSDPSFSSFRSQLCLPVEPMDEVPAMQEWCMRECLKYPPNCDPNVCRCVYVEGLNHSNCLAA